MLLELLGSDHLVEEVLGRKDQAMSEQDFMGRVIGAASQVGAIIMGISLAIGTMATPQAEKLIEVMKKYLQKNPLSYVVIILFVLQQFISTRRQSELVAKLGAKVSKGVEPVAGFHGDSWQFEWDHKHHLHMFIL